MVLERSRACKHGDCDQDHAVDGKKNWPDIRIVPSSIQMRPASMDISVTVFPENDAARRPKCRVGYRINGV